MNPQNYLFDYFDDNKSEYEKIMNKFGYGIYSNYSSEDDILFINRTNHLKRNNIEYSIGDAYDCNGKFIYNAVGLYIKDWNKPYPEIRDLCKLVNSIEITTELINFDE